MKDYLTEEELKKRESTIRENLGISETNIQKGIKRRLEKFGVHPREYWEGFLKALCSVEAFCNGLYYSDGGKMRFVNGLREAAAKSIGLTMATTTLCGFLLHEMRRGEPTGKYVSQATREYVRELLLKSCAAAREPKEQTEELEKRLEEEEKRSKGYVPQKVLEELFEDFQKLPDADERLKKGLEIFGMHPREYWEGFLMGLWVAVEPLEPILRRVVDSPILWGRLRRGLGDQILYIHGESGILACYLLEIRKEHT